MPVLVAVPMGRRAKSLPADQDDSRKPKKDKVKKEKPARKDSSSRVKKEQRERDREPSQEFSDTSSASADQPTVDKTDKIRDLEDVALAFGLILGMDLYCFRAAILLA